MITPSLLAPRYPLPCLFLQTGVTVCLSDILRFHELEDERPTLLEIFCDPVGSSPVTYTRVRANILFAEYPGLYSYWRILDATASDRQDTTRESIRWWISQEASIRKIANLSKAMGLDAAAIDMQLAQHFISETVEGLALPVELD